MTRFQVVVPLLCSQMFFATAARAQSSSPDDASIRPAAFDLSMPIAGDDGAQSASLQRKPTPGGRLLRHALIGAAVGAAVVGIVIRNAGDCGNCGADEIKGILQGAMYGALIGAAITIRPSRRAAPTHSLRDVTIRPAVSRRVKVVNVGVRF